MTQTYHLRHLSICLLCLGWFSSCVLSPYDPEGLPCDSDALCLPFALCIQSRCQAKCSRDSTRPCHPDGASECAWRQHCEEGRWTSCKATGAGKQEECDGKDNDCDGKIDESSTNDRPLSRECYTGAPGTAGVGVCKTGYKICAQGKWSETCKEQTTPTPKDLCGSGQDDNCDGSKPNSPDSCAWISQPNNLATVRIAPTIAISPASNDIYLTGRFDSASLGAYRAFRWREFQWKPLSLRHSNLFITRLDKTGNPIWLEQISSTQSSGSITGSAILVDKNEDIYVAGTFTETVDFASHGLDKKIETGAKVKIFVLKMNANRKVLWVKKMGGKNKNKISALKMDDKGQLYLMGSFTYHFQYEKTEEGASQPKDTEINGFGSDDVFIARLSADDGSIRWVQALGGKGLDKEGGPNALALANDSIYAIGTYGNSKAGKDEMASFGSFSLPVSQYGTRMFVVRLESKSGKVLWAQRSHGSRDYAEGVAIAALPGTGGLFVTGTFRIETKLEENGIALKTKTIGSGANVFVAHFSTDLKLKWATSGGSTSTDYVHTIILGPDNNPYLGGAFSGKTEFSGREIPHTERKDLYIFQLNKNNGYPTRIFSVPGTSFYEEIKALSFDKNARLYALGECVGLGFGIGSSSMYPDGEKVLCTYGRTTSFLWKPQLKQ